MSRYCFVVSACEKYIPELTALLGSLHKIGNTHDVFLIGYKLPKEFTDQFSKLCFKVIHYPIPEAEAREYGGEGEILCRKRYWYAAQWGGDYAAVCILDADMIFAHSVDQYFDIAEKCGLIVGASLEQKRIYPDHDHQKVRGKHLIEPTWNANDICCSPIFVDMKVYGGLFKESWDIFTDGFPETNFKGPDMAAFNLLILAGGFTDKVLPLCGLQFVGTNEQGSKPYIRYVRQDQDPAPGGKIWTETGWKVYIIHGQWYKLRWRRQQILNRIQCSRGYLGTTGNPVNMAAGAIELAWRYFKECLSGPIQIEERSYVNNGDPGTTVFGEDTALFISKHTGEVCKSSNP